MAKPPARQLDPWRAALACACLAVLASFVIFAVVLQDALETGETTHAAGASAVAADAPPAVVAKGLTYAGTLPAVLASAGLQPVAAGGKPDISFEPDPAATLVPARFFVPVVALGAGVDDLTRAQLDDVLSGRVSDWAVVGGVKGKVVVAAGPTGDQPAVAALFPALAPTETFATYDDLRAAMTLDSGIIAVVPLSEVRVSMSAVGIDGVDIVRGLGDATHWPFVGSIPVRGLSSKGNEALPSLVASMTVAPPKVTRVIATGDILQSRCSLAAIEASGDWASALRGEMADYLSGADLTLGSLDGSIQDINAPYLCVVQEYPVLTSPPEVMAALTLAGFDEMTVATNHVFDCGLAPCGNRAFLQTLDRLAAAGIKTVGGGRNVDEALAPAIFEINGVKFGVLGFDDIAAEDLEATEAEAGTAPLDDSYADEKAALPAEPAFYKPPEMLGVTRLQDTIRALKQEVDVVIVQIQSGFEDTHDASPRSIKGLRAAADAGADLVVGNQGHNVQSLEVRGNSFIAYALGNFIFDQQHTVAETQGYVLEASFWGKQLVNVRLRPYEIVDRYRPTFVTGDTRAQILSDIFAAAADLP